MKHERIKQHVAALGGIRRLDGEYVRPMTPAQVAELTKLVPLNADFRWWLTTYGGGTKFVEPIVYEDPSEHVEVLLGHFMDFAEITESLTDYSDAFPANHIPFQDDEAGNYWLVNETGAILKLIHDSPEQTKPVARTFEDFILMLRRGE